MIHPARFISMLLLLSMIAMGMLVIRMWGSGTTTFDFMLWNLGLAWMPLGVSSLMLSVQHQHITRKNLVQTGLFFLWLLLIPNAPYMITDLLHLKPRDPTPLWFDMILLQEYAVIGVLLCYYSLAQVIAVVRPIIHARGVHYISPLLLFVISFGVAVGRFFRWNSWDIFTNPGNVLFDLNVFLTTPMVTLQTVSFTVFFFFLLWGVYLVFPHIHDKDLHG